MKWRWPLLILLLAATIYVVTRSPHGPTLALGERQAFSLTTLDGETVTEVNPAGGVTVVEFWATWCGPCLDVMPHSKQLEARYRDAGVRFIGVSLDEDVRVQRRTVMEQGLHWINVNDMQQPRSFAGAWGILAMPHSFLLSPAGELLWNGHPLELDGPLAEAVGRYGGREK